MRCWAAPPLDYRKCFAALFGLVSLNKEFIRPELDNTGFAGILSGCFPNFIAAFVISLALVSPVIVRKPVYGRLIVYAGSIAVFLILALEELKPMWGASTYFDPYDIVAIGLGSFLAILAYKELEDRRL